MAKNRVMAQKNAKVRKCDMIIRRENRYITMTNTKPNHAEIPNNDMILSYLSEWRSIYDDIL